MYTTVLRKAGCENLKHCHCLAWLACGMWYVTCGGWNVGSDLGLAVSVINSLYVLIRVVDVRFVMGRVCECCKVLRGCVVGCTGCK